MEEFTGPLSEIFEDFKRKYKEFQAAPSLWETIQGFIHAVDWKVRKHGFTTDVIQIVSSCIAP